MKMHKKGITVQAMLILILVAVFIGILFFITDQIFNIISSGSEKQICILSGVLESDTQGGFKWECPIVKIQLEEKDVSHPVKKDIVLERLYGESKNPALNSYYDDLLKKTGNRETQEQETALRQFRINQIVGKELKDCWEKTGEGEFDLGGRWYNPFTKGEVFCAVCSRIKFTEDFLGGRDSEDSLNEYLMLTPHPNPEKKSKLTGTRISLYEFLLDESASHPFIPNYQYKTDEPYAVVYARSNQHGLVQLSGELSETAGKSASILFSWFGEIGSFFGITEAERNELKAVSDTDKNYAVDALVVIPLDEVIDKCTELINYG